MKISACLITKNEELNITKCINSFRQYVNEIIVVDTGSVDRTVQVAKDLGAKVFFFKWNNDFAQAKNFALKKAKGDWVIFLDADEYFAPADIRIIILEAHKAGFEAIRCELKNIESNDEQRVIDCVYKNRIFKLNGLIQYVGSIHESLFKKNNKPLHSQFIAPQVLSIFHTGYSSERREDKARRNLAILLHESEAGKKGLDHFISDCYLAQQEYEKVIYHAKLHIDSGIVIPGLAVKPYQNIVEAMFSLQQDVDDIMQFISGAMTRHPNHPIFHYYMAICHVRKKEYDQSFSFFLSTLELNRNYRDVEINKIEYVLPNIFRLMGLISEYRGQYSVAMDYFTQSLQRKRLNEDVLIQLLYLIKNQRPEDVILFLRTLYNIDNSTERDFLISTLQKLKLGIVYTYFVNLKENVSDWQENLSIDTLVVLLINGQYATAANLFCTVYENTNSDQAALLSVVATILADDQDVARNIEVHMDDCYKTILRRYFKLDTDASFVTTDCKPYLNVLKELSYLVEPHRVQKYIDLRHEFPVNLNQAIGDVFYQNKDYRSALYYYNEYVTITSENTTAVLFLIGCCQFKLRSFSNAVENFANALDRGYKDNDVFEYLRWSYQQTDSEEIRQRIAILFDRYTRKL